MRRAVLFLALVVTVAATGCATGPQTIPRRTLLIDHFPSGTTRATVVTYLRKHDWHFVHDSEKGHASTLVWTIDTRSAIMILAVRFRHDVLAEASLAILPRGRVVTLGVGPTLARPVPGVTDLDGPRYVAPSSRVLPPDLVGLFDALGRELYQRFGAPRAKQSGYTAWVLSDGTIVALRIANGWVEEIYKFPVTRPALVAGR
jgi:hypothetical protein